MPYKLFVSDKEREVPAKFGKTDNGKFTVKVGTKAPREFNTLGEVITFVNSEFGLKKKQTIPSDAELVYVEETQTIVLPKASVAERSAATLVASSVEFESTYVPKTIKELCYEQITVPFLARQNPKFDTIKGILSDALQAGCFVFESGHVFGITPDNVYTFDIVGYHRYDFTVSHCKSGHKVIMAFSHWIPEFNSGEIYIGYEFDNMFSGSKHFYLANTMKPSIREFVAKKLEKLLEN
jgi:hypothetical protein